jgi:hypothetical protein
MRLLAAEQADRLARIGRRHPSAMALHRSAAH